MSIKDDEKVIKYLDDVCSFVKNKKAHEDIREELISHIEDVTENLLEIGEEKDKAIEKAILKMGSFEVVGRELDKAHKTKEDYVLGGLALSLIFIGIFSLWIMGKTQVVNGYNMYEDLAAKSILYVVIGIVFAFGVIKSDYRKLKKYSSKIYKTAIILMIINYFISNTINGAPGYLKIGPIAINIIYVSTFLLIMSLAGIYDKYDWSSKKNVLKGLALGFGPILALIPGKSLATDVIYVVSVITLMIISGIKIKHIVISITGMIAALSAVILSSPFRLSRTIAFFNPLNDPYGDGYTYVKLREIRSKAGLLFKQNASEVCNIPEIQGELILSYIMYTFGFIACIVLVILVAAFIIRIGFIGRKTKDSYGKMLTFGMCSFFAVQFIVNILMNLTLMPVISISMPFVSYGGSNMVISIISLSIISSVYKLRNTSFNLANIERD